LAWHRLNLFFEWISTMMDFCRRNWFFIGMALMFYLGLQHPEIGRVMREYYLGKALIFMVFVLSGLTLDTRGALKQLSNLKVFFAALAVSLVITPVMALYMGKAAFTNPDFVLGALIIGVAPVTLASGTVLTALARGNVPLSLFICITSNLGSLISIPLLLKLLLSMQGGVDLPVWDLFLGLIYTVLLPTTIGQVLRIWLRDRLSKYKMLISIYSQAVVLSIILNAVSSSSEKILGAGSDMALVLAVMAGMHLIFLAMNYWISRALGLGPGSTSAFTIHTSQKTLNISYLVWAGFFAVSNPMAMIPGIAYHLSQMVIDTLVARRFAKGAG
jgi:sodium/bile acid cotransporter 7